MMPTEKQVTKARELMEQAIPPAKRHYLMADLMPRLEALVAHAEQQEREFLLQSLSKAYVSMNAQLSAACQALNYPFRQDEWKDSLPLSVMEEIEPAVAQTEWFQGHLGEIVIATGHPWWRIVPYPKENPSRSSPTGSEPSTGASGGSS